MNLVKPKTNEFQLLSVLKAYFFLIVSSSGLRVTDWWSEVDIHVAFDDAHGIAWPRLKNAELVVLLLTLK